MDFAISCSAIVHLKQCQAHVDLGSMLQQYKDHKGRAEWLAVEEGERETRVMLEQAQVRQLLEDLESDEEIPAQAHAKTLMKAKPEDILQEDSEPQAKKQKVGCWERSVGKLTSKATLSGRVARSDIGVHDLPWFMARKGTLEASLPEKVEDLSGDVSHYSGHGSVDQNVVHLREHVVF
ncbi:UNVERIFIED_CONTAM: hypothetical protein K2H54_062664 [Gekko kuhli]